MKNELFCAVRIGNEALDQIPESLDYAIQEITHKLADRIVSELENGEFICSLQDVEKRPFYDLNSVEIRRKLTLERLVRCKDCNHWDKVDTIDGVNYGICKRPCTAIRQDAFLNENWFCKDGKEKSDE